MSRQAASSGFADAPLLLETGHGFLHRLGALLAGLGFTALLFLGLARVQHQKVEAPPADYRDIATLSVPLPPPPPKIREDPVVKEVSPLPTLGLTASPSDSEVRIAASPVLPDAPLESEIPPTAYIRTDFGPVAVRPEAQIDRPELNQVFEKSDVDQPPALIFRRVPRLSRSQMDNLKDAKIALLFVVGVDGRPLGVKLMRSSGLEEVDSLIMRSVRDWEYSPAIRKGRKVRCWVSQIINFELGSGDPFSAN
jgi:protein TonB